MDAYPKEVLGRAGARLVAVAVDEIVLRDPYCEDTVVLRVDVDIPTDGIFEVVLVVELAELSDFELRCPGLVRVGGAGFLLEVMSIAGLGSAFLGLRRVRAGRNNIQEDSVCLRFSKPFGDCNVTVPLFVEVVISAKVPLV